MISIVLADSIITFTTAVGVTGRIGHYEYSSACLYPYATNDLLQPIFALGRYCSLARFTINTTRIEGVGAKV